ncbi:hypothetical protein BT96DRAFT_971804 [Gymnopus androsaceus JB14]|uniref:Uncharacterized protein n=1 Tax=Gymnopus androsaceus JB14 TaxID=1447944 RepID=A0A6A4I7J6_9AGAR|nr:hypothetical protein BT96DRAFT_971804 [Gymnopus androsaceus JB14]
MSSIQLTDLIDDSDGPPTRPATPFRPAALEAPANPRSLPFDFQFISHPELHSRISQAAITQHGAKEETLKDPSREAEGNSITEPRIDDEEDDTSMEEVHIPPYVSPNGLDSASNTSPSSYNYDPEPPLDPHKVLLRNPTIYQPQADVPFKEIYWCNEDGEYMSSGAMSGSQELSTGEEDGGCEMGTPRSHPSYTQSKTRSPQKNRRMTLAQVSGREPVQRRMSKENFPLGKAGMKRKRVEREDTLSVDSFGRYCQ